MTTPDDVLEDHKRIWLEICEPGEEGRLWCQDNVWPEGEATEYVRADIAEAEVIALRAEVARMRDAVDSVMVGGNHLANVLIGNLGAGFAERFPPDMDHETALRSLCATDNYDVRCCWSSMMLARAALSPTGDKDGL